MIPPEEAWDIVASNTAALSALRLPLAQCLGHVLAQPLVADRDIPPADRAAMDGFAVRAEDVVAAGAVLSIRGEVAAGSALAPEVEPGVCVRIYTGANIPPGADTVVRVEDTAVHNGESRVTIARPVEAGVDILMQGEDAAAGDELLPAGSLLTPAAIGLCAATGCATPSVHALPRVSVLATGEELLDVADDAGPHQIRDSNSPALAAALAAAGMPVVRRESVRDDLKLITSRIECALADSNVVIVTGGVSVGKYDFGPDAIRKAGARVHFHGVAMKPGKPQLFATTDAGRVVWGLPGNPLSAMTGYGEFVLPMLRRLSGRPLEGCRVRLRVTLADRAQARPGKHRYLPARLEAARGLRLARLIECHGSADLVAGAKADGVVEIPAGTALDAGGEAWFTPWRNLS